MTTQPMRPQMPRAVDLDEAARRIQGAVDDINNDPSLTAEDHATGRVLALMTDLNNGSRRVLTDARDKIDDLMRALDARSASVTDAINEYAGFVQASVSMAGVIMGPIEEQARIVGDGLKPAPGKTVTQR